MGTTTPSPVLPDYVPVFDENQFLVRPSVDNLAYPPEALAPIYIQVASGFRPKEKLMLAEWCERHMVLSSEYAARASAVRLFGWQKEIFNSFSDPLVEDITLECARQLTKTLFLQGIIAYTVDMDPGPIMLVQPKDDDAKRFSKERLKPMIRDCGILHGKIGMTEKEGNLLLDKEFPGGSLMITGAGTAGNAARRSNRIVLFDEIDKYPMDVGHEGDFVSIAIEGAATFTKRKKIVKVCSPTNAGTSRIHKSYLSSDMRRPWVPCHVCGTMQVLRWGQVRWDPEASREEQPKTARYQCNNKECGALWNDYQRKQAAGKTEWRAEKPFNGKAGFWISHLYSPWKDLSEIVDSYLDKKDDPLQLKTFINTVLAEVWETPGETPDAEILHSRREDYPHSGNAVVPARGLFLTAAVDVQDSPPRLECEIVAWGRNRENWSIGYFVISGQDETGVELSADHPRLWERLDNEILKAYWPHESGKLMSIMAMGIDTGKRPKPVYNFASRNARVSAGPSGTHIHAVRTVVPIKGNDDALRIISAVSKENAAVKRQNIRIVTLGTHCIKQELFDCLKIRPRAKDAPTAGLYHFPLYDLSYFNGLASEKRVVHEDTGKVEYVKKPNTRNEPIDLKVYNRGMATLVGIDRMTDAQWKTLETLYAIPKPVEPGLDSNTPASESTFKAVGEMAARMAEALTPGTPLNLKIKADIAAKLQGPQTTNPAITPRPAPQRGRAIRPQRGQMV